VGWFEFGWEGPLRIGGEPVELHTYKRFDNPYCQCDFTAPRMTIRRGEETHEIDLSDAIETRV
jgi:hypothetical protein